MRGQFLSLLCLAGSALAAPHNARWNYAVKETHNPPRGWKKVAAAPADHVLTLTIGLKQGRFHELEHHLSQSSNPSHSKYGDHLTADAVNKLIQPDEESLTAVHEWLAEHGVTAERLGYSPAKDWITVSLPVSKVEEMLDTEYAVYEHGDGDRFVRTPQWSLPKHLHKHVDVVQPTNSFFRPDKRIRKRAPKQARATVHKREKLVKVADNSPVVANISTVCNATFVTPTCLRTLYGTIDYQTKATDKNLMGINNFLGEVNNHSDTNLFLQQFRPEAAGAGSLFTTQVIAGGNNGQGQENATRLAAGADIEGDLDSETMLGIAWPTNLTTFNTGGSPPYQPDLTTPTDTNEPYLTWLQAVLAETTLPYTISTSYADDEQTVPYSYAKKACDSFAQIGARGTSLFFGSGDEGVGTPGDCVSNDGTNRTTFLAEFPSSCPYVTTVGATKDFNPEVVAVDTANGFVSGGGFSNYFPRPDYQNATVGAYVASLGNQFAGLYNQSGRGYPDVSAQGFRFAEIWNGTLITVDGTSASTPTVAAIITLVNDALLAANRSTLGFLNPWLYSNGNAGFTDVTSGSAIGCNTTGFPAATGWDAVTGFGTPQFSTLLDLALETAG